MLGLVVQSQAACSLRMANGGMDAAAILKKQLEDKDQEVKEIQVRIGLGHVCMDNEEIERVSN